MENKKTLPDLIRQTGAAVAVNEPMSKHTTFKVGGPAELFISVSNTKQLSDALSILNREQVPVLVTGRGSNLLVRDAGIKGAVIRLSEEFEQIRIEGKRVYCAGGAALSKLINKCCAAGLSGLEDLAGIPSSAGGAIAMNAGSFGSSIGEKVSKINAVSLNGTEESFDRTQCGFGYRTSVFLLNELIICEAQLELEKADTQKIKARIGLVLSQKAQTQPLKEASAGCIFKNPKGRSAGELIEKAGLKGLFAGGAKVSQLHANYIVNTGGAKASDIIELMEKLQRTVKERFLVDLEPEIKVVGH